MNIIANYSCADCEHAWTKIVPREFVVDKYCPKCGSEYSWIWTKSFNAKIFDVIEEGQAG